MDNSVDSWMNEGDCAMKEGKGFFGGCGTPPPLGCWIPSMHEAVCMLDGESYPAECEASAQAEIADEATIPKMSTPADANNVATTSGQHAEQEECRVRASTDNADPELKVPRSPIFPCLIQRDLNITLDRVCASMFYLWFPRRLAYDIVLIRIQKVCRETQYRSGGRINIDNGCIEQGRIVIRVNLAEADDGGEEFWRAILEITRILCTTTDIRQRSNFLSDLDDAPDTRERGKASNSRR